MCTFLVHALVYVILNGFLQYECQAPTCGQDKIRQRIKSASNQSLLAHSTVMGLYLTLALLASLSLVTSDYVYEEPLLYDFFDPDFMWGAATSSYQVN